jgi:uncharacterized damage-inducible protein DinB
MRRVPVAILLTFVASPALAQQPAAGAPTHVSSLRGTWDMVKDYVVRAAEKMPAEHFTYKPTPEVRSFGQLLGHIANANYMICSTAKGEQNPNAKNFEETTDRAAMIQAVKDSFTYCDGAYGMSESDAAGTAKLFGRDMTRAGVLAFNTAHDFEHYGNVVTYMRMKGVVPPSSEPRSGG